MDGLCKSKLGHEGVRKLGQLGIEIEGSSGRDGSELAQPVRKGKISAIKVSLFMIV